MNTFAAYSRRKLALFFYVLTANACSAGLAHAFYGGCVHPATGMVTAEGGCKETKSGTVWTPISSTPRNFEQAQKYCQTLTNGEWSDWSLPTLDDVKRLVQSDVTKKVFHPKNLYDFVWVTGYSTEDYQPVATLVSDDTGEKLRTDKALTVCVRRGIRAGLGCRQLNTDYFATANGGCQYKQTGKVYSQRAPKRLSVFAANDYCSRLVEGGYQDWRLPSIGDLKRVAWPGGADKHFLFDVSAGYWASEKLSESNTYDSQLNGRKVLVTESKSFYNWVQLSTGMQGRAIHTTHSLPHNGGYTKFYTYEKFQTYDLSRTNASVICIRP